VNRPPWQPRSFGSDADHGMEDLQTDVMRFMAILGFCLVAIFALVQSLPFPPPAPHPEPAGAAAEPVPPRGAEPTTAQAHPDGARPSPPTAPPSQTAAPTPSEAELVAEPAPEAAPEPSPAAAPSPDPTPVREGISLRFASNEALRQLVTRGEVTLYAVAGDRAWRMAAAPGRPSFTSASPPTHFHEMARGTVPPDLVRAVRRIGSAAGTGFRWGVVLPGSTTGAIQTLVRDRSGGDLVIDSHGDVRWLETAGHAP